MALNLIIPKVLPQRIFYPFFTGKEISLAISSKQIAWGVPQGKERTGHTRMKAFWREPEIFGHGS
jgi:hypothetical protein